MRWMIASLLLGLLLGGTGLGLLWFSNVIEDWGIRGIALIVALVTAGVFLIVPAKIYIILRFTRPPENRPPPPGG
jgi:hypothetical protein